MNKVVNFEDYKNKYTQIPMNEETLPDNVVVTDLGICIGKYRLLAMEMEPWGLPAKSQEIITSCKITPEQLCDIIETGLQAIGISPDGDDNDSA